MSEQATVERVARALYDADLEDTIRTRGVREPGIAEQMRQSRPWSHARDKRYWFEQAEAAVKAYEDHIQRIYRERLAQAEAANR